MATGSSCWSASPCGLLLSNSNRMIICSKRPCVSLGWPLLHRQPQHNNNNYSTTHLLRSPPADIKKGRGGEGVCHAAPFRPHNVQLVAAISSVVLTLARGTPVHKSLILPFFFLQAPKCIISWIKGEYGVWSAFLALFVRLFWHIPGELELPFLALVMVIIAPHQIINLRGTREGSIISLFISLYLAFQHFSRTNWKDSSDKASMVATVAIVAATIASFFLLI